MSARANTNKPHRTDRAALAGDRTSGARVAGELAREAASVVTHESYHLMGCAGDGGIFVLDT
jgi:hypothetical protein